MKTKAIQFHVTDAEQHVIDDYCAANGYKSRAIFAKEITIDTAAENKSTNTLTFTKKDCENEICKVINRFGITIGTIIRTESDWFAFKAAEYAIISVRELQEIYLYLERKKWK